MIRDLLAVGAGSIVGCGLFVVVAAWRDQLNILGERRHVSRHVLRHGFVGAAALIAARLLTGWTIAAVTIGVAAAMGSVAVGGRGRRRDDRSVVEAIAVWTEQLRDMLAGSNGLEQAISATAAHAPAPLRAPIERLVASMSYLSLPQALQRFAKDVDHPTADFVIAALSTAATRQVRELGALLGHLASCARDEARMQTRIWVGRSRTRSSVKIIGSVVIVFVAGLALLSPDYLAPYRSTDGQLVLSMIILIFFASLLLMQRLAMITAPERFIGRRTSSGS